jgi:hypothetical protein
MSMRERESLIARIRHLRRIAPADTSAPGTTDVDPARLHALETRMAHLEQLVEGLQDSVHREFQRDRKRISDLEARIEPAALGAALNRDARERGL